jgi:RNA-directed DNA polymerase
VGWPSAATPSITRWIKEELRLEVNASKSGVGQPWERKFLGFRINREGKIEAAPQSVERMKNKVRELWRSCQSLSSAELRDRWRAYIQGWWAYYGLAEERRNIFRTETWIRRHIRCCFWQRWHTGEGRMRHLRELGMRGRLLQAARSTKGAWKMARNGVMHKALSNAVLRRHGFVMPSDLAVAV